MFFSYSKWENLSFDLSPKNHSYELSRGSAPLTNEYIVIEVSHKAPSAFIWGLVRLNITVPKPSTSLCLSGSKRSVNVLPTPAAPPPITMSAEDDRAFI